MFLRITYIFLFGLFFLSTMMNKNYLLDDIHSNVNIFNTSFNRDIQTLNREINYLNRTKVQLPFRNYKTDENIVYFDIEGSGVFFKNLSSYPNLFNFYNLKEGRENLNKGFNKSLLEIVYCRFNSAIDYKQVVYTTDFSYKWLSILKNGSLALNYFKKNKNISRNNTEFILYDIYTDKIYEKEMFTIVFPEYDYYNRSLKLRALWYFDFSGEFFAKKSKVLSEALNLDVAIVDSNYNVVYSTKKVPSNLTNYSEHYYAFALDKTNYQILIEKENILQLIELKEIILLLITLSLIFHFFKKEKLEKELKSLKIKNKIKSELMLRDPLTALYNRYFLQEELQFPLKNCGVVLLDIDYFKNINDNFGHESGDFVLKGVSNCIKLVARSNAYAFRWGGEEFLIIFKGISKAELSKKVISLQNLITKLHLIENQMITASFGVIHTNINDKIEFYSAVSKADENLYKAKKNGRNKVVF